MLASGQVWRVYDHSALNYRRGSMTMLLLTMLPKGVYSHAALGASQRVRPYTGGVGCVPRWHMGTS